MASYEAIQSDIFDHLIAIIPEFGLRIYQAPSGHDFQNLNIGAANPTSLTGLNEG